MTRVSRPRRYLACEPRHFAVQYAINPWMRAEVPVDTALAGRQWETLMGTYRAHGHTVETVAPVPGLPDMVFAANSALVVGGQVFGSQFHAPQRRPESTEYETWFKAAGYDVYRPESLCEGEAISYRPAATSWRVPAFAPPRRRIARCRSSSACRRSACSWWTRTSTTWTPRCSSWRSHRRPARRTSPTTPRRSRPAAARCCGGCSPTRCSPPGRTPWPSASTPSPTAAMSSSPRWRPA